MKLRRLPVACLVACVWLHPGCQPGGDLAAPAPGGSDTLKRGNGGDPGSLDPALAVDVHAYNVLLDLYEGLLAPAADGAVAPGVARSWTRSDDGLSYEFELRRDARWSNGTPVLAGHFVNGFRRVVNRESHSPNAFLLSVLENFQPVMAGEVPETALGIRAVDDYTLIIRLARPAAYFPAVLTMPVALPRLTEIHDDPASFRDPGKFVGNGAYVLDELRPGAMLRLRRNDLYRVADEVSIPYVEYHPITNAMAEFNMFRTGELDITATIPSAVFADARRDMPENVRIAPGLAVYYLAFDLSEPPLDDLALRKALSLAIDREQIVGLLGRGELAAYGLVPPGVSGHEAARHAWQLDSRESRIALAREAYAASGYSADQPLTLKLTYDAGDEHEKVALAIAGMWREALGVDVSLRALEWKMFLDGRRDRESWQVMRFSWFGDYDDPSTFTGIFLSGSEQNLPGYASEDYDALLGEAAREVDVAARRDLMHRAEQTLLNDYPIAPVYFFVNKHLVGSRVLNYASNPMDRQPSRYLRLRSRDEIPARTGGE